MAEMCCKKPSEKVSLTEDVFGEFKDSYGSVKKVRRFTWKNQNGMSVQVMTYGGYITSMKVPDSSGHIDDIVLGFNTFEEYLQPDNRFMGATVGRVANRIANAKMTVEGVEYKLAANNGPNHIHGGTKGFDKVLWEPHVDGSKLTLSYLSKDMEEGYPGDVLTHVTFELTNENEFKIEYKATTSKPTPINLTNHSYFNLAGDDKGANELYKHVVSLNADKITEAVDGIPTGNLPMVCGTPFDLRVPKTLGDIIHKVPNTAGFDHNFCVTKGSKQEETFVARVTHSATGRALEVYSNQPGVQFYTSNFLPEGDSLRGKNGFIKKHFAFCLETQKFPDSVNHKHFPNTIVYPGEEYYHTTTFKLLVDKALACCKK
ncbi:unnamed protein product [Acanthoscelides obtectus]|uniref:Aldose 1-epimerase n=1 Tax=Acanthoscelides obtectus TaxID=200917 RepID=A0A9P0L5X2_ACAOB|nr:unnamed protein product [Acanthoscelides obtectus]CAK1622228.1 Aldose 1-epimerase [Acanthoscelides obtectus]